MIEKAIAIGILQLGLSMKRQKLRKKSKDPPLERLAESVHPAVSKASSIASMGATSSKAAENIKSARANRKQKIEEKKKKLVLAEPNDSTESVEPKRDSDSSRKSRDSTTYCDALHDGRLIMDTEIPLTVEEVFELLFTNSKFLEDFHKHRNSTDVELGEWTETRGRITRINRMTVTLVGSFVPKNAKVTERQVMRDCSKPGNLYSIDISSTNEGVPYADSFVVELHYCIVKIGDEESSITVFAEVNYTKPLWGLVKNAIDKASWHGMEEYFDDLLAQLQHEVRARGKVNATLRKTIHEVSANRAGSFISEAVIALKENKDSGLWIFVILIIASLVLLNMRLLRKIAELEKRLEQHCRPRCVMPNLKRGCNLPPPPEEWMHIIRQQNFHMEAESKKWHRVLLTAIGILKKANIWIKKNKFWF